MISMTGIEIAQEHLLLCSRISSTCRLFVDKGSSVILMELSTLVVVLLNASNDDDDDG